MNVLLLGANGQLGWELSRTCPEGIRLHTCDFPGVDFTRRESLLTCLSSVGRVDCLINAAAYTAVDQAETDRELAYQVNETAVDILARICADKQIRMVHMSTDFVFSGTGCRPYRPHDPADPGSVYGSSKLAGERAVRGILGRNALIIRTAWLYSVHGSNFVKTMIRLMEKEARLTVVDDQIGTPTWANGLAQAVWAAVQKRITGIHHWTDAGVASWYDFAVAVQENALASGLLNRQVPIVPVGSDAFPTPARRPHFSVLDKSGFWAALDVSPVHWRTQLNIMLKELAS